MSRPSVRATPGRRSAPDGGTLPRQNGPTPTSTAGADRQPGRTAPERPAASAAVEALRGRSSVALRLAHPLLLPAVGALALSIAPLLLVACCAPADAAGFGSFWFTNDYVQYEAAAREGAASAAWLVHDHLTAEPHQPALMFPLYVALGKMAAALGLAPDALLRPAETLGRALFLLALARFVETFAGPRLARPAFLLALFAGGLWLPMALPLTLLGVEPYAGNGSYETTTFGLLFAPPHVTIGMALTLELAGRLGGQPAGAVASYRERAGLALLAGALALLHPFHLPVLLAALGVYRLALSGPRGLLALLPVGLAAAPPLAYSALVFNLDPFWGATYGRQNLLPSPPLWALPLEYGLTLLLALPFVGLRLRAALHPAGARRAAAAAGLAVEPARRDGLTFLLVWIGLMLLASYLPVPYQRRFAFGLGPALAVPAALGLAWCCARLVPGRAPAFRAAVVGLAACGTVLVFVGTLASAIAGAPLQPYRVDRGTAAAADWLGQHTGATDVTLASWDTMNYLAGRLPGRVVGGHPVATLETNEKRAAVERLLANPEFRPTLLPPLGATYLLVGPRERAACPDDCAFPGAEPVYRQGDVAVFRLPAGGRP